jgi:uncharacterized protein YjiS (DUF1127 family)
MEAKMAYVASTQTFEIKRNGFNPIKWLLALERAYRDSQKLKATEDHHLLDMGITRRQANAAFYTRFSENRYYSRAR